MDPISLKHLLEKHPSKEILDSEGNPTGSFTTCVARLSFSSLNEGKERINMTTGVKYRTWGCALIFPPAADLFVPRNVMKRAARARFESEGVKPESLIFPLKEQSTRAGKYHGFENEGFFCNVESRYAVEIFGSRRGADGLFPRLDPASDAVYSGMWVIAELNAYTYPKPGTKGPAGSKKGVSFGLRALQKVADDEEFTGGEAGGNFGDVDHGGVAAHSGNGSVSAPRGGPAVAPSADSVW